MTSRTTPNILPLPAAVEDRPGEFAWINKDQLNVDESYQRDANKTRAQVLAKSWSWVACGAISVSLRSDASWWVMDGQHRVLAAKLVDSVQELPCLVFEVDSIQTEAIGFLNSNTNRRQMTATQKHRALIMAGEHISQVIEELVVSSGRHVSSAGGKGNLKSVSCVGAMWSDIRESEITFRRIWPVLSELCTDYRITQGLVHAFYYLERMADGESLVSKHWRERMRAIGIGRIEEEINSTIRYRKNGNRSVCAVGLANAINTRARIKFKHRIQLDP